MPRWTEEQELAIKKSGTNIIVSASAGSGKTAVLTERVIQKLKQGVNIDQLLILTFTKAAALEMKERIKKGILKDESLSSQLDRLDKAYITTFDSFALSILKKYHYIINISNNIKPEEGGLLKIKEQKLLEEIMNEKYEESNSQFIKFIYDFCLKDDTEIKKNIFSLNDKLNLRVDKEEYLSNYLNNYFNDVVIENDIKNYEKLLLDKINNLKIYLNILMSYVEGDYFSKVEDSLNPLFESTKYEEIKDNLNITLPNLPKNTLDGAKKIKEEINKEIDELKEMCEYKNVDEIKNLIDFTKDNIEVIIEIIIELDKRMNDYKKKNELFSFNDIAIKAIEIIKNNPSVLEEIKNSFEEIMIDEYQDTSDIQETFISLISNNNVYMVGDIKQSIYRFRNANPYIFKNKYDSYKKGINGYKIDLSKNFRSREEVLKDINHIFNHIMDDNIGGANYVLEHQMIFGNNIYNDKCKTDFNQIELWNYDFKESKYSKEEIECFFIARDIEEKVKNKYQVMDKETNTLRDITYNDFVILMDKSKNFILYKKIFEYLNIPLIIKRDENLLNNVNIGIIKNIINLVICYRFKKYDNDFVYSFMSIGRSYLFNFSDDTLFNFILNKNYDSILLDKIKIMNDYLDKSISEFLNTLIEVLNVYENLINIGNIDEHFIVFDYLEQTGKNLENLGFNVYDFYEYLIDLTEEKLDIKYSLDNELDDAVKIMTIHGSKGLEFPICYYSGLYSKFNVRELNEKVLYDDRIIIPANYLGYHKTIYYHMMKEKYLKEEISEEIRLFYVALTRAREKMIIVVPIDEQENLMDNNLVVGREKYRSFKDILNSITCYLADYIKTIDIGKLNITKDYNYIKKISLEKENSNLISVNEIFIENEIEKNQRFSKNNNKLLTKNEVDLFKFGEEIHYALEIIDFKNPNYSLLEIPQLYKEKIKKFLSCELFNGNILNIYKEYEFIEEDLSHGIIDLILEKEDKFIIVDYKLKNIDDDAYLKQLNGYKEYLSKIVDKNIEVYLYSIVDENLKKVA